MIDQSKSNIFHWYAISRWWENKVPINCCFNLFKLNLYCIHLWSPYSLKNHHFFSNFIIFISIFYLVIFLFCISSDVMHCMCIGFSQSVSLFFFWLLLSTPVHVHGGLICIALRLFVRLSVLSGPKFRLEVKVELYSICKSNITYCMVHLQAIVSHLLDTKMMVYGNGRWSHFNVKLHFIL